jgi:hypothetical protein
MHGKGRHSRDKGGERGSLGVGFGSREGHKGCRMRAKGGCARQEEAKGRKRRSREAFKRGGSGCVVAIEYREKVEEVQAMKDGRLPLRRRFLELASLLLLLLLRCRRQPTLVRVRRRRRSRSQGKSSSLDSLDFAEDERERGKGPGVRQAWGRRRRVGDKDARVLGGLRPSWSVRANGTWSCVERRGLPGRDRRRWTRSGERARAVGCRRSFG